MKRIVRSPIAILGAALLASGCGSWERTRKEVVDPINQLLHREYPAAMRGLDRERLDGFFEPESADDAARASREIIARFRGVAAAQSVITSLAHDGDEAQVKLSVQVDGIAAQDGEPMSLTQRQDVSLRRQTDGSWRIAALRAEPARVVRAPAAFFADEAAERGLVFTQHPATVPDRAGQQAKFLLGSGAAAGDIDSDGWDDAVLLDGDHIEVFLNRQGRFERRSEEYGVGAQLEGALTGALLADFDNDGRKDLFVGRIHAQPIVYLQRGGRFAPIAESGIRTTGFTISATAADFDNDGRLDLYLANNADLLKVSPEPMGYARNAEPNNLLLGNGDGTFRDVSEQTATGDTGWSLVTCAGDYDADGDVDIFLGNDFGPDVLYRNNGKGGFEDATAEAGITAPVASMGSDWGDFDGDGDLDLFVAGMASNSAWIVDQDAYPLPVPWLIGALFRPWVRKEIKAFFHGNRFYENRGDGSFAEISLASRTSNSGWAWGTNFVDLDNDGLLDVFSANGFISGPVKDDL